MKISVSQSEISQTTMASAEGQYAGGSLSQQPQVFKHMLATLLQVPAAGHKSQNFGDIWSAHGGPGGEGDGDGDGPGAGATGLAVTHVASSAIPHAFSPIGSRMKPFSPQVVPHEFFTFQYGGDEVVS